MPAATDSRQKSYGGSCVNRALNVADIGATRNQPRPAIEHAIPDAARCFIGGIARQQQVTVESFAERREHFFAGYGHLRSLLK
jgi:hypothetical protein